jgi:Ser/Thr protein kinase RdoA (MazF antagonist)
MSRVPGRVDWFPKDLTAWLRRLADLLPPLHETQLDAGEYVQEFKPYEPPSWEPPEWLGDKRLWERALTIFHGPRLDTDRVFIHRDYHPGNVLWRRGSISGLVDWQAASVGPRAVDVWHCRGNLLSRFGERAADQFVAAWQAASGQTYNPWAETVMLVDAIGWLGNRSVDERQSLEALLARRIAEFSG